MIEIIKIVAILGIAAVALYWTTPWDFRTSSLYLLFNDPRKREKDDDRD